MIDGRGDFLNAVEEVEEEEDEVISQVSTFEWIDSQKSVCRKCAEPEHEQ